MSMIANNLLGNSVTETNGNKRGQGVSGRNTSNKTHICPHSMSFMLDNWIRRLFQNPRRLVGSYIDPGDCVIDLGCGPGFFTIDMARMVGTKGKVIAVDIQEEMLRKNRDKARGKGLDGRIIYHQSGPDGIGLQLEKKADFILAYYMIHETGDLESFLREVTNLLKPGGRFLAVEPRLHVNEEKYLALRNLAWNVGYTVLDAPPKKGGRSLLLTLT